jgi:hypothetical protein
MFKADAEGVEVLWSTDYDTFNLVATPVILDDMLFGGDARGRLRCIDLETGSFIGKPVPRDAKGGSSASMSVLAAGGKLILLTSKGVIHVGEPTSGGFREIMQCDPFVKEDAPRLPRAREP